ncbi:SLC13 family permease [Liberiplasma polymorphum]|uniref:SLC13 family permease n=1 Tax=Liberiplasma polymorphum TaxID=3374570 RepID=UPI003773A51B
MNYLYKDKILLIAMIVAIFSIFFVKPSLAYIDYISFKVLIGMFGLMLAVAGLYEVNFFSFVTAQLLKYFRNIKIIALVIILTTFFLGMLMTNDAVLLTLVPFSVFVYKELNQEKYIILTVILQTLAANLGSALMPMGDPQNIYLYTQFNIPFMVFIKTMLPVTITGLVLIVITTLLLFPSIKCSPYQKEIKLEDFRVIGYGIVLFISIACILGLVSNLLILGSVLVVTLLLNFRLFNRVDYGLLITFVMFFIFSGNFSQLTYVQHMATRVLSTNDSVYYSGLILSQFISNVPSAVLLSTFAPSHHILSLLQGVNVGAMGTMIASLASLITFKFIVKEYPHEIRNYLIKYSLICIVYITVITVVILYI